jgi:hypothetical protein
MAYYEEDDLQRFAEIGKHRPDLFEKFMACYQACQELSLYVKVQLPDFFSARIEDRR